MWDSIDAYGFLTFRHDTRVIRCQEIINRQLCLGEVNVRVLVDENVSRHTLILARLASLWCTLPSCAAGTIISDMSLGW